VCGVLVSNCFDERSSVSSLAACCLSMLRHVRTRHAVRLLTPPSPPCEERNEWFCFIIISYFGGRGLFILSPILTRRRVVLFLVGSVAYSRLTVVYSRLVPLLACILARPRCMDDLYPLTNVSWRQLLTHLQSDSMKNATWFPVRYPTTQTLLHPTT
jgi:hypothetical protein